MFVDIDLSEMRKELKELIEEISIYLGKANKFLDSALPNLPDQETLEAFINKLTYLEELIEKLREARDLLDKFQKEIR